VEQSKVNQPFFVIIISSEDYPFIKETKIEPDIGCRVLSLDKSAFSTVDGVTALTGCSPITARDDEKLAND
jgi:hypothetical protein